MSRWSGSCLQASSQAASAAGPPRPPAPIDVRHRDAIAVVIRRHQSGLLHVRAGPVRPAALGELGDRLHEQARPPVRELEQGSVALGQPVVRTGFDEDAGMPPEVAEHLPVHLVEGEGHVNFLGPAATAARAGSRP
jgi:hypothetical protein